MSFVPFGVGAESYDYDLGVSEVTFNVSENELIAGSKIRIYSTVINNGKFDVAGYVSFYQGPTLIGRSSEVTAKAGAFPEQAWVDFTIPSGSFNIRVELVDLSPQDQNSSNNIFVTKIFSPQIDSDGDKIIDSKDNCPTQSNSDQKDNDHDGQGDVCDSDDDNDGILDTDESSKGTSAFSSDTDQDGISDAIDNCPTLANKDQKDSNGNKKGDVCEPIVKEKSSGTSSSGGNSDIGKTSNTVSQTDSSKKDSSSLTSLSEDQKKEESKENSSLFPNLPRVDLKSYDEKALEEGTSSVSKNFISNKIEENQSSSLMAYERYGWKTFRFYIDQATKDNDAKYYWKFSDGQETEANEITREFPGLGIYRVSLYNIVEGNQILLDELQVQIGFLDYRNPWFWMSLGILIIIALLVIYFPLLRTRNLKKNEPLLDQEKNLQEISGELEEESEEIQEENEIEKESEIKKESDTENLGDNPE